MAEQKQKADKQQAETECLTGRITSIKTDKAGKSDVLIDFFHPTTSQVKYTGVPDKDITEKFLTMFERAQTANLCVTVCTEKQGKQSSTVSVTVLKCPK